MREFLISVIVTIASLMLIDNFSSSIEFKGGIKTVATLAIIINILNMFVTPMLQVLAIPVTIITLGLFYFVVNGIVLSLAFSLTKGARVKSLWSAIWISIVLSILESLIMRVFG